MPGIKSLEENQYYAHPQNAFWEIMEALFGISKNLAYQTRLQKLREEHIALWDVAYQCHREGSLDSKIKNTSVTANDFENFFKTHKHIKAIFFNGQKAEHLFKKFVLKNLNSDLQKIPRITLPSTSPAHASLRFEQKKSIWQKEIKNRIKLRHS